MIVSLVVVIVLLAISFGFNIYHWEESFEKKKPQSQMKLSEWWDKLKEQQEEINQLEKSNKLLMKIADYYRVKVISLNNIRSKKDKKKPSSSKGQKGNYKPIKNK